ncbi:MAG: hybrid sensor histidine kinase/response regulator, partial [Deltaproteobacteria bacterium]|nr:hybrid sensor histidine kinase/response regulator [Deltaproteobacteria bacterium]
MADPIRIHQIVMNLCTNAYHAMEEMGGKLTVNLKEVELAAEDLKDPTMIPGPHVSLTVADTGPGMEQNIIDRIFDPYFTTKEEGKGTGLGL